MRSLSSLCDNMDDRRAQKLSGYARLVSVPFLQARVLIARTCRLLVMSSGGVRHSATKRLTVVNWVGVTSLSYSRWSEVPAGTTALPNQGQEVRHKVRNNPACTQHMGVVLDTRMMPLIQKLYREVFSLGLYWYMKLQKRLRLFSMKDAH